MDDLREYNFNLALLAAFREFLRGSAPFSLGMVRGMRAGSPVENAVLDAVAGWIEWESGAQDAAVESWKEAFFSDDAPAAAMLIASMGQGVKYIGEGNGYLLGYVLKGTTHIKQPADNIWIPFSYLRFMENLAAFDRYHDALEMYREAMACLRHLEGHEDAQMRAEAYRLELRLDMSYGVGVLSRWGWYDEAEKLIGEKVAPAYAKLGLEEEVLRCYHELSGIYIAAGRYFEALLTEELRWSELYGKADRTWEWIDSTRHLGEIIRLLGMKGGPGTYIRRLLRRCGCEAPDEEVARIHELLMAGEKRRTEN